jgi:predicted PurR-regulated permease PerM
VRNLLVLVLVAMFLAVSLDPAVRWLTSRGLPRGLAVALILVVRVAILAAFLVLVIPHLVSQFTTLVHTLPSYLTRLADRSRHIRTSTPATTSASAWKAWSAKCPSGWPAGRSESRPGSSAA